MAGRLTLGKTLDGTAREGLKKINVGRGGWWQAAAADGLVSRAAAFNCNISDYNSVVRLTMADIEAR